MDSKRYKREFKKPVTDKIRTCLLPGCKETFEPNRQDKKFCCQKHKEKHWRMTHKRVYNKGRHSAKKAGEVYGYDGMRRDEPSLWLKYMKENPLYLEALGVVNINSLGI